MSIYYSSLRSEGAENIPLGFQVPDLCFWKQNCTRNPNMGSKESIAGASKIILGNAGNWLFWTHIWIPCAILLSKTQIWLLGSQRDVVRTLSDMWYIDKSLDCCTFTFERMFQYETIRIRLRGLSTSHEIGVLTSTIIFKSSNVQLVVNTINWVNVSAYTMGMVTEFSNELHSFNCKEN